MIAARASNLEQDCAAILAVNMMHWIWTVPISFVTRLIAKAIAPGSGPSGFLLTAIPGIAGALAVTIVGQLMLLLSRRKNASCDPVFAAASAGNFDWE